LTPTTRCHAVNTACYLSTSFSGGGTGDTVLTGAVSPWPHLERHCSAAPSIRGCGAMNTALLLGLGQRISSSSKGIINCTAVPMSSQFSLRKEPIPSDHVISDVSNSCPSSSFVVTSPSSGGRRRRIRLCLKMDRSAKRNEHCCCSSARNTALVNPCNVCRYSYQASCAREG